MRMNNFFNEPININDKNFCNEYVSFSQAYWDMADEELMSAVSKALEEILINLNLGKDLGAFNGMSEAQIISIFTEKKIRLISQISDSLTKMAQRKLSEILLNNKESAQRFNMQIPEKDTLLSVREYFDNYLKALEYLKRLELILGNKKGGLNE